MSETSQITSPDPRDIFMVSDGSIHLPTTTRVADLEYESCSAKSRRNQWALDYHPDATCPVWENFLLTSMGNEDQFEYIRRIVGYTLTGHTREQAVFLVHGAGHGKSTFLTAMQLLLGPYAQAFNYGDLNRGSLNLGHLRNVRMAVAGDDWTGTAVGMLKQMTGGDIVTGRYLYGETFSYIPEFKMFIVANSLPSALLTDHGVQRRMWLIPFQVRLSKGGMDRELMDKLRAELPGILNWSLAASRAWYRHGLLVP